MPAKTPGRRRTLDRKKKTHICDLVARGATVGDAAAAVSVSIRTVQREARRDPDFDQELRRSQSLPANPLKLMEAHARSHWRAAAWLLERENSEDYGRRPANSCTPFQLDEALKVVVEAALRLAPEENRAEVYRHLTTACETAYQAVFPHNSSHGRRFLTRLPKTPLRDAEYLNQVRAELSAPEPEALARASTPSNNDQPSTNHRPPHAETPSTPPPAAGDPNPNPNPNRTGPASSDPTPPHPTPDRRLSWSYLLRAARTASSVVPPSGASARIIHEPILSPKTPNATISTGDKTPPNASTADAESPGGLAPDCLAQHEDACSEGPIPRE